MARILLLDDSPTQTICMQRQLHKLGHEVCHAAGLSEALSLVAAEREAEARKVPVDLAIVELTLLQDNGFDVGLSLLRGGVDKVLLLSGARRETDDIWAQALGLQGVLSRPLTSLQLGARIAEVLAGVLTGGGNDVR